MLSPLWPYRDAPIPAVWGPSTSLNNYCEEDYIITGYVAEFINTLTNLIYVFYAYYGLRNRRPGSYVSVHTLPYIGLGCVGFGSAAFHGTVKYQGQWSDDLAMLLATGIVLHRVMSFNKSARWGRNFGYALTTFLSGVSIVHCYLNEQAIHQTTFVVMVVWVAIRTAGLIDKHTSSPEMKRKLQRLSRSGSTLALAAYAAWIIDQRACSTLQNFRRSVGLPWGFLTELHGWWHLLTGVAVYIYIVIVEYATADHDGQKIMNGSRKYAWPVSSMLHNDEKSTINRER